MKWIWVRHGETDSNRQGRYLGHSDVPLNDLGQKQAEQLAERLKKTANRPVKIYASDLQRCIQTAGQLAAVWSLPVTEVPALRELSFGDWELLTYAQLMETDGERAVRWYDDPFANSPPNGESLEQLGSRVDQCLHRIWKERQDSSDTIVFVSHGGVIRWFQAAWLENDPARYWHTAGVKHGEALIAEWNGQQWVSQSLDSKRGTT